MSWRNERSRESAPNPTLPRKTTRLVYRQGKTGAQRQATARLRWPAVAGASGPELWAKVGLEEFIGRPAA